MKSALIAAVVSAIVAAASGTAATIVVTSKQIKNGTIQTVDLSAKAQRALKGARGVRGANGLRGAAGPPGAQGPQGPAGVSRVRFVTSPTMTIAAGAQARAEATCPAGETAAGGGFGLAGAEAGIFQSVGVGTAWIAQAENAAGADPAQLTAYAYCVAGADFIP
jgi:hypothetical protein